VHTGAHNRRYETVLAHSYATIRRTAAESISLVVPLKIMLTPTSVPIAHTELTGQALPIITASSSVTMPSSSNQPLPGSGRSRNDSTNSSAPSNTR